MTATVYRFRDAGSALLYVGLSSTTMARFHQHEQTQWWWVQVATIEVEHFATRQQAAAAEIDAIRAQLPRYNIEHHPAPKHAPFTDFPFLDEADGPVNFEKEKP